MTPHFTANANPNVGGGLPPMAVCQLQISWLTHRYRGQAPSHIFLPRQAVTASSAASGRLISAYTTPVSTLPATIASRYSSA
ncbi:hypothetical protein [Pseudomonas sp. 34 E 7]|nr:hypothetical protein [Pseudomonas sp. 34 E 7]